MALHPEVRRATTRPVARTGASNLRSRWAPNRTPRPPAAVGSAVNVVEGYRTVEAGRAGETAVTSTVAGDDRRPRARDLGVTIGSKATGRYNAITDVAGV